MCPSGESLAPWAFPFDTLQARSLQLAKVLLLFFSPFSSDRVICMQFRKHSHREPPKDRQPVYLITNQSTTWFLEQWSNWLGILSVSLADANKQGFLLTIYLQNTDWFQETNISSFCKVHADDLFQVLKQSITVKVSVCIGLYLRVLDLNTEHTHETQHEVKRFPEENLQNKSLISNTIGWINTPHTSSGFLDKIRQLHLAH